MSYESFNPNDLLIQAFSTKPEGNFGPHRTPAGIRVIHLPTGTVVTCEADRSQHRNRHLALTQLWDLVQGKPSYKELAAQVEVLRTQITKAREYLSHVDVNSAGVMLDLAMESTPTAFLPTVQAEAFVRGAVWESSRTKGGIVTIEDVREVARSLYNRIRQGGDV